MLSTRHRHRRLAECLSLPLRLAALPIGGQGIHRELPRHHQHRHSARRRSGAGRHPVEPRGACASARRCCWSSSSSACWPARRARRHQVRRRAGRLHRGLGGARPDPVRRRSAHALSDLPQRDGARWPARDRRRPRDRRADRARRHVAARPRLDRVAADRRRRRLDRRGGRVLPGACARPAAAAAGRRDAGGRIRHQRSVRHLPHHRAGGDPAHRRQAVARDRAGWRRKRCSGPSSASRRPRRRFALNRLDLPQGLHAPFVATSALVIFGLAQAVHGSGYLAIYLAGLVVGNRPTRAHNTVVAFLDAATWLAQIVMFVLLGLLVWPDACRRRSAGPGGGRGADADRAAGRGLPLPRAVPLLPAREAVHLLGGPARRGRHLPRLDPAAGRLAQCASLYFDVAFVVVLVSLLVQGWTIAPAARWLMSPFRAQRSAAAAGRARSARPARAGARRLSGRRQQPLPAARPGAVVGQADAGRPRRAHPDRRRKRGVREGDYVYLLAPPEKAQALDRFFVDMPPPASPIRGCSAISSCRATSRSARWPKSTAWRSRRRHAEISLADHIAELGQAARGRATCCRSGRSCWWRIAVADGRVTTVGLRLAEDEAATPARRRRGRRRCAR